MKTSQKIVDAPKLKVALLLPAGLTSGRGQLRTQCVKLTPHTRELVKELLNCSITLLQQLLLA